MKPHVLKQSKIILLPVFQLPKPMTVQGSSVLRYGNPAIAWNLINTRPRRLLLDSETAMPPINGSSPYASDADFDSNMVIILAALLCALICALGLNSIVRCALRCSNRLSLDSPDQISARLGTTGLDKSILSQIPVVVYGSGNGSGLTVPAMDCPICLGEFSEGDKVRILPKCSHSFHVKCIDTWLISRSSCPTCRRPLLEYPATANVGEVVVRIL